MSGNSHLFPGAPTGQPHRERSSLTAEELRQGKIILTTRRRRVIFIAGLVGFVLFAALMGIVAW